MVVKAELAEIGLRWEKERNTLSNDRSFLEGWLEKLAEFARLAAHQDGRITMVQQLLSRLPYAI